MIIECEYNANHVSRTMVQVMMNRAEVSLGFPNKTYRFLGQIGCWIVSSVLCPADCVQRAEEAHTKCRHSHQFSKTGILDGGTYSVGLKGLLE